MNRVVSFFEKQHGISNDLTYDFALRRLCVASEDSWRGITPSNYSSDYNPEPPIFAAKFANCKNYAHILAIANEDGKIALQDTTLRNTEPEEKALNAPQCHYNAVFDLEWAPGQMQFVSASGDHTARLWDVGNSEIRPCRVFNGHTRSVKTAAFRKRDSSVFATGGRDGAILIWDTRANLNMDLTSRADNCIFSGHSGGPGTPVSQRKKTRTPKLGQNTTTTSSITGLVFQDSTTLISCGAGDGIIKVWDLRRNYTSYKKEPLPKYSLPYAGSSTFKGFTNLLIDEAGAKLYANCMDNSIYCYNLFSYSTKPLQVYHGLRNSTFYIKSCLSPDGKYLISGSSDEKAYIWNLNKQEPLVALLGHTVEVTCVAWGSHFDMPIVTCSDDARHKIWRIGPETLENSNKDLYCGRAELCQITEYARALNTCKHQLRELECTPRSLKRLVEQNEKTPSTEEKIFNKRSFAEVIGENTCYEQTASEQKRQKIIESKGRRLFSPTGPNTSKLCKINEEHNETELLIAPISNHQEDSNQENKYNTNGALDNLSLPSTSACALASLKALSPLSERILGNTNSSSLGAATSPTALSSAFSSVIFSPTSNLPNYVVDGDAPHLGIMSPKRKSKDKVDWLTKIRKQKLMSTRSVTLMDKIQDDRQPHPVQNATGSCISSPRLQSLRSCEESPRLHTVPRRRISHSGSNVGDQMSPSSSHPNSQNLHHTQRTPTSSRRNSETSILRFFTAQHRNNQTLMRQRLQQHQEEEQRLLQQSQNTTHHQTTSCTD